MATTKRILLHNNTRLLMTFGAGLALRELSEEPTRLIKRAAPALDKEKHAGTNPVVTESNPHRETRRPTHFTAAPICSQPLTTADYQASRLLPATLHASLRTSFTGLLQ